LPKSHECVKDCYHFRIAGAREAARDGLRRGGRRSLDEVVADSADALGKGGRPWEARGAGGLDSHLLHIYVQAGLNGNGSLELWAEPPH
jgi:hypothetical protein